MLCIYKFTLVAAGVQDETKLPTIMQSSASRFWKAQQSFESECLSPPKCECVQGFWTQRNLRERTPHYFLVPYYKSQKDQIFRRFSANVSNYPLNAFYNRNNLFERIL
jgi:hypothetical protein